MEEKATKSNQISKKEIFDIKNSEANNQRNGKKRKIDSFPVKE